MGEPMPQDRRKTQRQIVNRAAKIQSHDGAFAQGCLVTDMSDGGVRLFVEDVAVPDDFVLFFDDVGGTVRKCRLVWRLDSEIGAEFVDAN